MTSTWWSQASEAQKLAQIDGGIELAMTANQIGMASGATMDAVSNFAYRHGRHFGTAQSGKSANRQRTHKGNWARARSIKADQSAYLSGQSVDFWHTHEPQDDPFLSMQEGA